MLKGDELMKILEILLIKPLIETIYLTGMIILIGLLLGVLRNGALKNFMKSFGFKSVMITGFIGVPIHECSHALIAILFKHSITDMKLLQKPDASGTLGYVRHSYNPKSIYQQVGNFFIGIAPIFGGLISLILLMKFLLPASYAEFIKISTRNLSITSINTEVIKGITNSYYELIRTIFAKSNFDNPYFYLFLFLAICISSHISLSRADINGAFGGLVLIFLIIIILNMFGFTNFISVADIVKYNVVLTGFLLVALIFSMITYIISGVSALLIK